LERLLQDDRPAVHPLVHEVDRHAHHAYAVIHGLLDGPEAPKRRKQRRMHVDNPPLEAADELRTEDLHEAGEHHQIHLMLVEPVAENTVASISVAAVLGRVEHAGVDRRGARTLEPPRAGGVGGHADHLHPIAHVVRPTPGRAPRATDRIAWSRFSIVSGAGAGASGTSPGSQTSQHGPDRSGSERSPKWRRIAVRRHDSLSTYAQISRYWRQRA